MAVARRKVAPSKAASAPKKRVAKPATAPTSAIDRALRGKYVGRKATDYQRQFARWLVTVVGVKPSECESLNQAFLLGLQMGIVSRPDFMASDFLRDWREENGMTKPGRLPGKAEAVEEEIEEEIEPDEFDEDEDEEDDEEEDEEYEDEEEEDDEEEIEPEPVPVKPAARRAAKKAAPQKATKPVRKAAPVDAEDDFF